MERREFALITIYGSRLTIYEVLDMTAQEHNKLVAVLHLVNGGLGLFGLLVVGLFVFLGFGAAIIGARRAEDAAAFGVIGVVALVVLIVCAVFVIPSLIAGYGMLKRKPWARTAGIIAALLDLMSFPLGTALGVYSLWFLFGEEGNRFYMNCQRDQTYTPPPPQSWQR
jgi:amino acid transporter